MIIVILLVVGNSYAGDGQYECGPNGRFEYCIDDNPGCVVGCHCYPGYYFDTDTKICEPNTKLTQDFRRHFIIDAAKDATTTEEAPAPTRTAPEPDAAKDDDLSDWLYNQFFKTIENQVINKTDDDELLKKGTRRSGGPVFKRKFKKKRRSRKGFKKSSKHELRRKLLRISEDDSMFDSASNSRSDSEGTSSSSSWESWGPDEPDPPKHPHDDNEHGHRKIVIFSKKPKPPLPSFIFLPNIETPFYPPIGLPVPPLPPPMYPMIPVPPIQSPPEAGNTPSTAKSTAATTSTAAVATTAAAAKTTAGQDASPPSTPESASSSPTTTPTSDEKSDEPDKNSSKPAERSENPMSRSGRSKLLRSQARNNLLQRLKERNKTQRNLKRKETTGQRLKKPQIINNFMDQLKDPSIATGDLFQQPILEDTMKHEEDELRPFENDVDFKYLTQLIHRVDVNGTTPVSPKMQNNINGLMNLVRPPQAAFRPGLRRGPAPARRSSDAASPTDDSYYTKLGREIAELIRDIHPDEAGAVNIDVEHEGGGNTSPFFGENSFAPRSYWERFVRSPKRFLQLGHFSKYGNAKSSNEKLFDLENKVEIAANSSPVLSLPELENVIYTMEIVQNQIHSRKSKEKNKRPSNNSLNVSLLPRPREKLSNAPIKTSNSVIKNQFGDRRLLNQHNFRRNNVNFAGIKASDRMQANHTNNNKRILTQHDHDKLGYNIPIASTSAANTKQSNIKENTMPPNPKYQLRPAIIQNDNRNHYFSNTFVKMYPNFPSIVTESYRPYKESKPSYFFNQFDYFI